MGWGQIATRLYSWELKITDCSSAGRTRGDPGLCNSPKEKWLGKDGDFFDEPAAIASLPFQLEFFYKFKA
jgi:hypothetical protein